ncbi:unnamed protein product [Sphagnum troendelagicum]|uniref:Uncharacterized protein n=1 Tax=Sphagnum troendelagicum TaxID=128251 RepID=A0ABP0USB8_9BRYO
MSLLPAVVQVALFILEAWHSGFGFFRCLGNQYATYMNGDYMAQLAIFDLVRRGRTFPPTWGSHRNNSLLKNFSNDLGELIAMLAMPFTYNDPFSNKLQFMGRAKVLYFRSQARTGIHVESQDPNQMPESGLVTRELYDKIDFDDVQTRGYYKSTKIREVTFVVDYIARQRIEVTYNVGAIRGYASLDYSRYRLAMVIGMLSELSAGAFIVDLHQLPNQQNRRDGLRLLEDLEHEWQQDNPRLHCMTLPEIMEKINQDMTLTLHPKIFDNAWF